MTAFEKLSRLLDEIEAEADAKKTEEFYRQFWEGVVILSKEQFNELLKRSDATCNAEPQHKAWHYMVNGLNFAFNPDIGNALETFAKANEYFDLAGDTHGRCANGAIEAIYYKNTGQFDKALLLLQNSFNGLKDNQLYSYSYLVGLYQAGEINFHMRDFDTAIDYFKQVLQYPFPKYNIGTRALNAIGNVYVEYQKFDEALVYFEQSLQEIRDSDNFLLKSKIYADIGNYHFRKNEFTEAENYFIKSIELRKEHKLFNPLITSYTEMAELFLAKKDYENALYYANEARIMAEQMNVVIKLHPIYKILSLISEERGDTATALEYFKKFHQRRDEVLNQENTRKIKQMSVNHQMDTMQKEKEIFVLKNVKLKSALDEIESSVRYAKRIQHAILPSDKIISQFLPDYFVLYKPKDIVAGDFYWVEKKDDYVVFATADCTGHGVPGAIVSVICNNALNRNLHEKEIFDPGELLNHTREAIIQQFQMSEENVQDGMDISLCVLKEDVANGLRELKWAGANNPLWLIRNNELTEYCGDKQPIGKFIHPKPFTTHSIDIKKGDRLFLFTDGFQDQFGGNKPEGKKFKATRLKELILSLHHLPMKELKEKLNEAFENWRGELEQIDDVCIMGVGF